MYSTDQRIDGPLPMCMCRAIYSQASMAEQAPKRPRFIAIRSPGRIRAPTPRATDLVCGPPTPLPPPTVIAHQLAQTHHLAVGIDIETHNLVPGNTKVWAEGQFGFKTTIDPDSITAMRLIEIGFAIGDCHGGDPIAQSCVIRPDGFMVSCEATRVHHISHGDAVQDGIPLKDALELMVTRVLEAVSAGHRIVSHHLEFDAGIIAAELVRAGLQHLCDDWAHAVKNGFCTMNPDVAMWVRSMIGMHDKPYWIPMRIKDMVDGLLPNATALLGQHHRARDDALMHWHLYADLLRRAAASRHDASNPRRA